MKQLLEERRSDIRVLIKTRNAQKYTWSWLEIKNTLFVYAVCCSDLEYTRAIKELNGLENQLPHYSDNYYNALCKNLKSYCNYYLLVDRTKYQFSNKKLIAMLRITKYEESYLDSIISDEERERRENLLIAEELENRRIESEIENSIQNYEMNQELKDFTAEEYQEYSRKAFEELGLDSIIFSYRDPFMSDSDM